MRKVDNLGRIVISKELRTKYGLFEGANIEFEDSGDGITVRASENLCKLCDKRLEKDAELPLCEECIKKIVSEYKG